MRASELVSWPITALGLERITHGLNNDSYFVRASEGEYVLRVYRNTAQPARVRDEHDLLARLALADLPYATPVPLRTTGGDTLAVLETAGGPRLASLFDRIPGTPAELTVANARLAGTALARLDLALAQLDLPVRAPARLRDVHPLVPEPAESLIDLGLDGRADPVRALFARVEEAHDALVSSLPRQIVHGDFAFPNLLVREGEVTGLVDFEFAAGDHRAADPATAMYVIAVRASEERRWNALEAFAAGYRRVLPLDPLEIAAVPELMVRRAAMGLVHWIGRWRAGVADPGQPLERVDRSTAFVRWLDANGPRLVVTLAGAARAVRR